MSPISSAVSLLGVNSWHMFKSCNSPALVMLEKCEIAMIKQETPMACCNEASEFLQDYFIHCISATYHKKSIKECFVRFCGPFIS